VRQKGNCDADLIVKSWQEFENYEKAIFISSDGDFVPLYQHLKEQGKFFKIGIPSKQSKSYLLNQFRSYCFLIESLREKIEYKKKE